MTVKEKIRAHTKAKLAKATLAQKAEKTPGNLAPARPSGLEKKVLAKKLTDLLNNGDIEGAVKVWREGLAATKFAWSAQEKRFVDTGFPDWDVRERMSLAIAAYMEGRPVERQMVMSGKFEDFPEFLKRLQGSPEARRALPAIDAEFQSLQNTTERSEPPETPPISQGKDASYEERKRRLKVKSDL